MNRSELIADLVDRGAGDRRHVTNMLKCLEEATVDALSAGEDVTIPGIVKLSWGYRAPQKKAARWRKGDEVTGFGGVATIKEEDSPPVTEKATIKPSLTGAAYRTRPKGSAEDQKAFFATKLGKAVRARKKRV